MFPVLHSFFLHQQLVMLPNEDCQIILPGCCCTSGSNLTGARHKKAAQIKGTYILTS